MLFIMMVAATTTALVSATLLLHLFVFYMEETRNDMRAHMLDANDHFL